MYTAHKREDGKLHPLKEHLTMVSTLAGQFAEIFGAREHAERTGMLHDIGKYGAPQQRRMNDPENVPKVDHSTAGVQFVGRWNDLCAAFAIAGHHGGLLDKGTFPAKPGTLAARIVKQNVDDYSAYQQDGVVPNEAVKPPAWVMTALNNGDGYTLSVYIRMLFSCLVDADFLNTEAFMLEKAPPRGVGDSPEILWNRLTAWLNQRGFLTPQNELNARRSAILRQCMDGASREQGLYTLTVPTGGGKTVASLAFALAHAVKHGLQRVIYVVPYTNIIEQTAQTFREILGEENVLEHHANVDFNDDASDSEQRSERRRLAAENWDAPVIVTTAVQFYESFYGAKPSKCRKLHNVAGSVLIFDEAQMMPPEHLTPCVAAIAELVKHYRVTAVLCTATQPALDGLFRERGVAATELIEDADELYQWFRRVTYVREGTLSEDELCARLCDEPAALCIVNTRKQAQHIYEQLPPDSRFHLSTLMTPENRRTALKRIRELLREGKPCHVVSTSLIEAGVDVDFPTVWREEAGLDSILQSGGRCNREGKRAREQSVVHVYEAEDSRQRGERSRRVSAMHSATSGGAEMDSPATIHAYFSELLLLRGKETDAKCVMKLTNDLKLKTIAEEFHLIDSSTASVVIPTGENAALIERLQSGAYTRHDLRAAGAYSVSVYDDQYKKLLENGMLMEVEKGSLAILMDVSAYDTERGLTLDGEPSGAMFV